MLNICWECLLPTKLFFLVIGKFGFLFSLFKAEMPTQVRWLYLSWCRQLLYVTRFHCRSIVHSLSLKSRGNSAVLTYTSIPDSKLVPPAWDQDSRVTLKPWEELVTSGLYPGEGDGSPRQNSCLENPMDRGALWAPKTPKRSQRVRHDWRLSTAQWIVRDSFKSFFKILKNKKQTNKKHWSFLSGELFITHPCQHPCFCLVHSGLPFTLTRLRIQAQGQQRLPGQFSGWKLKTNLCMNLKFKFKFKKLHVGLPRWLSGKLSTCQCRRCRLDPWVGKMPLEEETVNPLQYSCPENPIDRGA